MAQAGQRYSMLTIGDGLVTQIPALLRLDRGRRARDQGDSSDRQPRARTSWRRSAGRPRATLIASGMMFAIGFLPGMPPALLPARDRPAPHVALDEEERGTGSSMFRPEVAIADGSRRPKRPPRQEPEERRGRGARAAQVDRISLEIGYRLIPLVQDEERHGHPRSRLAAPATLRDARRASCSRRCASRTTSAGARWPTASWIGGQEVAVTARSSRQLPGHGRRWRATGKLRGKETPIRPSGCRAWWIAESQRDEAELLRLHGHRPDQRPCYAPQPRSSAARSTRSSIA